MTSLSENLLNKFFIEYFHFSIHRSVGCLYSRVSWAIASGWAMEMLTYCCTQVNADPKFFSFSFFENHNSMIEVFQKGIGEKKCNLHRFAFWTTPHVLYLFHPKYVKYLGVSFKGFRATYWLYCPVLKMLSYHSPCVQWLRSRHANN